MVEIKIEVNERTETVTTKDVTITVPFRVAKDLYMALDWFGSVNTVAETTDLKRKLKAVIDPPKVVSRA